MHPYRRTLSALATTALMSSGLTVGVAAAAAAVPTPASADAGPVEDLLSALTTPLLQGTPQVGQALTVTKPLLDPLLGTITGQTVQWFRGTTAIPGATGWSYQLTDADADKQVTAEVTSVVQVLLSTLSLEKVAEPLTIAPAPTGPTDPTDPTETLRLLVEPVITGLTTVGSTLTATNPADGDWSLPGVQESIQWFRDGAAVPGADDWTYTLQPADLGTTVHAVVTGSLLGLLPVEKVLPPKQVEQLKALFTPLMAGLAKVGETLSVAKPGDAGWNHPDVTSTIQWFRDNVAVPGATGWTFPVTPEDAGAQLTAVITGTLGSVGIPVAVPGKTVEEQEITAVTPVAIDSSQGLAPDDVLGVKAATWDPSDVGAPAYEWRVAGTPVGTGPTYTIKEGDVGKAVTVVATVTKGEGEAQQTGTSTSAPVTPVADEETITVLTPPSIAPSDADYGETLTAVPGTWSEGTTPQVSYRWFRGATQVGTGNTYQVQLEDVASQLTVVAEAVRGEASATARSAPVTVDKLVARTTAKLARKRIRQGQVAVLRIKTRAVGVPVPGKVKIFDGRKRIRTVRVGDGVKKVRIKKLGAGVHKLKVVHSGNQYVAPSRDKVRLVVKKRSGR